MEGAASRAEPVPGHVGVSGLVGYGPHVAVTLELSAHGRGTCRGSVHDGGAMFILEVGVWSDDGKGGIFVGLTAWRWGVAG